MKIAFLDAKTMGQVPNFHVFEKFGDFVSYPITKPEERLAHLKDADVAITCKVVIDRSIIDACPNLKLICVAATGTNNVDVEYALSKDIPVKNVANYSTESVAQITLGIILSLVNRLNYFDRYVKTGAYTQSDMFTHYGPEFYELNGKRAGIIGLGNIGKRVARLLEAFGMEIVYYSASGKNNNNDYLRVELEELLATSDIVSIHSALNDQTTNLITLPRLRLMKPTAFLVNAGRGGIINEHDLVEALNHHYIAGAGLDVYEREPMSCDSPILKVTCPERLILTPHAAWTSIEARTTLINRIAENIADFLNQNA
ncbi:MAG: D-2-hydroxyacid dehydrogenase [Bacteroidota bacterium]|nr:D-2-hydroxyacid dehydrogenase [Bacteroidota bacterium]